MICYDAGSAGHASTQPRMTRQTIAVPVAQRHPGTVLLPILGALAALGAVAIDMYLPALPAIAEGLETTPAATQLTLSAFFVGFGLGQLIYGPLADRFGRRLPLLVGLGIYLLASIGCALSTGIEQLIAWRFVQALGGCASAVIARAVVRDLYEADAVARVMSLVILIMTAAPLVAPLIGGYALVWLGWRAIFWLLAGFGLLCVLAVVLRLPETHPPERRRTVGAGHLLADYARLLRHRPSRGYILCGGFAFAGMFTYISATPFVYIEVFAVAPEHYGWLFGLNVVGVMLASYINSCFVVRLGTDRMLNIGVLIMAAAGLLLLLASTLDRLLALIPPLFFFVGMIGLVATNAAAGAMRRFPELAGTASGLFGAVQFAFGALAGGLAGLVYDGSAVPMALIIALCGLAAWACYRFLASANRP